MKKVNMKHVTLLLLYTAIVFVISFIYKDSPTFESYMIRFIGIVFLILAALFLSQTNTRMPDQRGHYLELDRYFSDTIAREKEKSSLDLLSLFGYIYIVLVPLLALWLLL